MRYVAYLRKSEEDKKRQIQSIPRQRDWCRKTATRRNLKIEQYFEDNSSGHRLGRSGFQKMIDFIENSTEPIGILTWKISRLARNPIDEGIIKYAFMRKKIGHIIARDREYKKGENQIIMSVDFGQATQYSIELSKDVIEGMNQKIAKGFRPTKAPYGYINDPHGQKGERKIYPCKIYFEPIQKFLKLYSSGFYTVPELQKIMTDLWGVKNKRGKPFSLSTLYKVLERRFYCGEYLWNGKIKKGKHKPMITRQEYEKIQGLLGRKRKPVENKYQNYYSGFITCSHCQSTITGYTKIKYNKHKGKSHYHYLRCTKKKNKACPQCQLNRADLDTQILAVLEKLELPYDTIQYVIQTVLQAEKRDFVNSNRQITELKKEYGNLENEISVLGRKLAQGILSDELFEKLSKEVQKELDNISRKLEKSKAKDIDLKKKLDEVFVFGQKAKEKFKNGSFEEKKQILKTIGANFSLQDDKLTIKLRLPFFLIEKNRQELLTRKLRIEPEYKCINTGQNQVSETEILGWSSSWEELRTYFLENDIHVPKL